MIGKLKSSFFKLVDDWNIFTDSCSNDLSISVRFRKLKYWKRNIIPSLFPQHSQEETSKPILNREPMWFHSVHSRKLLRFTFACTWTPRAGTIICSVILNNLIITLYFARKYADGSASRPVVKSFKYEVHSIKSQKQSRYRETDLRFLRW